MTMGRFLRWTLLAGVALLIALATAIFPGLSADALDAFRPAP